MSSETMQTHELSAKQHFAYRGRVRTGCLTCRSRKVKCDEHRPICKNCTRLMRTCTYSTKLGKRSSAVAERHEPSPDNNTTAESEHGPSTSTSSRGVGFTTPSSVSLEPCSPLQWETTRHSAVSRTSLRVQHEPFYGHDALGTEFRISSGTALQAQHEQDLESDSQTDCPSTLISRDIRLTTTMDLLKAQEDPLQSLVLFFVDRVECPNITPYDSINWQRMKLEVIELGKSEPAIMSAIMAYSAMYRAQLYGLPRSQAISFYHVSKCEYAQLPTNTTRDRVVSLVVAFFLCLFTLIHYHTVSVLQERGEEIARVSSSWTQAEESFRSALSRRIVAWMKLLHIAAFRGGGAGLLSETLYKSLPPDHGSVPGIEPSPDEKADPAKQIYEMCSAPVIQFYFKLQEISRDIAKLTHYHRSRITGHDQHEVTQEVTRIKERLKTLWESSSAPQRQTPSDIRSYLAAAIADPLIGLVGVCEAAYHAEFVEIGRLMGDPVSEHNDSKEAMRRIREIVDGDEWNAVDDQGNLRSGYLRPLFLYAIECMDAAENAWAVERLRHIHDPVCRSEFFAAFAEALCATQLRKDRRVTSKYFSIWYFGMAPPFL